MKRPFYRSSLLSCSGPALLGLLLVVPLAKAEEPQTEKKNVSVTLGATKSTTTSANGEGSQTASTKTTAPSKTSPKKAAAKEVPKDPENKSGISPFWEKIGQGDTAAIAHDYTTALSYYQSALTTEPKNPIGHLRMAEVSLKQNQLEKVPEYLESALRFSTENLRTKAQTLFLMARLAEQQNMIDDAIAAWAKYKALAIEAQDAAKQSEEGAIPLPVQIYVTTADLRTSALTKRKETMAAYEEVRARIEKNVEAADQATGAAASKEEKE